MMFTQLHLFPHKFVILGIALLVLGACQVLSPSPTSPPPTLTPVNDARTTEVRRLPVSVSNSFDVNSGIHINAVVQSATQVMITVQLLKPIDIDSIHVRQQLIPVEDNSQAALLDPMVQLQTEIISNYYSGITLPLSNADQVVSIPYEPDVDFSTLDIPPENIYTYSVPLLPANDTQAIALLIEQQQGEQVVASFTSIFKILGDFLITT